MVSDGAVRLALTVNIVESKKRIANRGFIIITRQGGRNRASLFAITWKEIDECKGKLDIDPTKFQPGQ